MILLAALGPVVVEDWLLSTSEVYQEKRLVHSNTKKLRVSPTKSIQSRASSHKTQECGNY